MINIQLSLHKLLQVSLKVQYCTHMYLLSFAINASTLAWLDKSIAAWTPSKDVESNLRVFHRTGHCPYFVQRRCLGNWVRNHWKGVTAPDSKRGLKSKYDTLCPPSQVFFFGGDFGVYLRLSGWNKEPSRWLGQGVKPFVCLVGPWNRLKCGPRIQTFAYTNWFASQAKPRKWYCVHFMKGSCFSSMSHEDMFSTVRPFCLHLFASAIILGFVLGF